MFVEGPHVGGVDGISCQHLQVLTTNLLQKHWEWQEERNPVMKHGTVVRPTMYMGSLDIKSAFDEARPMHIARIMESHNLHGWLIAALLREMSGLEGGSMFECVESSFTFNRCLRQGSVEAPPTVANDGCADVGFRGKWTQKNMGLLLYFKGEKAHQICSFMYTRMADCSPSA